MKVTKNQPQKHISFPSQDLKPLQQINYTIKILSQ